MKHFTYRFNRSANLDIEAIWQAIAQDSLDAADHMIEAIYERVLLLTRFPYAGHGREDLADELPVLFSPVGKYLLMYRVDEEQVVILAVVHGARDIPEILHHRISGKHPR